MMGPETLAVILDTLQLLSAMLAAFHGTSVFLEIRIDG